MKKLLITCVSQFFSSMGLAGMKSASTTRLLNNLHHRPSCQEYRSWSHACSCVIEGTCSNWMLKRDLIESLNDRPIGSKSDLFQSKLFVNLLNNEFWILYTRSFQIPIYRVGTSPMEKASYSALLLEHENLSRKYKETLVPTGFCYTTPAWLALCVADLLKARSIL